MAEQSFNQSLQLEGLLADLPVVSGERQMKVVLDNEVLRLVMFSFDAKAGLPEHSSDRAVVVTCLDGKINFVVDGNAQVMNPGDVVYMAPGAPHSCEALEASHMSVCQVVAN